jgi:tight adherence protein B
MSVLAALAVGVACALLAGACLGRLPELRPWRARTTSGRIRRQLAKARVASPARFWLASGGAALVTLVVVAGLTGSLFIAVVPAGAVAVAPSMVAARRERRRRQEVQAAWPDALRDLVASISAGQSLTQAASALASDGPVPLRPAFARFPELARVLGTAAALGIVKQDLADPTSDRVIEVLELAHERGGVIVRSILEDLVDATTRDIKLADEIETEGLEMRINARAVVVLPWLVLVALTMRPGPFRAFYRSSGGVVTLAIGGVLTLIGVVVLGRLGREGDEARVFDGGTR